MGWTNEQYDAITKKGCNIIVSAGAGSGKTAVLSERVIRKLKEGVNINELLILTFTNAASAEMKERIRDRITKEESLSKQLDLISSSYISTFDGFSLAIVKKYHYILNINQNVGILDANINKIKTEEILESIFNELYVKKDSDFEKLISDYCVKSDDKVKNIILEIFDSFNLLIDKDEYLRTYEKEMMDINRLEEKYNLYSSCIIKELKKVNNALTVLTNNGISLGDVKDEIGLIIDGKKEISKLKQSYDLPNGRSIPDKKDAELKNLITARIKSIYEIINEQSKEDEINLELKTISTKRIIIRIIKMLDERLMEFKIQNNSYTFTDIAKMAIKILKENDNIRNELKHSFNEIMIDEYQDTSDIQEYFINMIENNNVYMVGDIKQSIYRFRNANPKLFQKKYEDYQKGINGYKIDLTKNFRSRKEVISDINEIFSPLMTIDFGGADYQSSHMMLHGNTDYDMVAKDTNHNALIIEYENDTNSILSNTTIEAFIIAKNIKDRILSCEQVLDKSTKQSRNICYSDFCILTSTKSNFDEYKRVFNACQIPLDTKEEEEITTEDDIKVINNILKLLASDFDMNDVKNRYYLTSIERSFLFEKSDDEIFNNFVNDDYTSSKALSILKSLKSSIMYMSINEILSNIYDEFEILDKAKTVGNIKQVLVHLEYLDSLASSLSNIGYSFNDFVIYLDNVFSKKLEIKYLNHLSTVKNACKMMTIHASKGLEFGICYFPDLSKGFNNRDARKSNLFNKDLGFILEYNDHGKRDSFLRKIVSLNEINENVSERLRLLYVALTRAKEQIVFVTETNEKKQEFIQNSFTSFLNYYFDKHQASYVTKDDLDNFVKINEEIKKVSLDDNDNKEILDVVSQVFTKKEVIKKSFSKKVNTIISENESEMLELGTLIHEALERLDFINPDYDNLLLDVKYHHYLKDFLSQSLLSKINEGKIYKEYKFWDEVNDVVGSIDLMIEYDDHIDIIDYKLKHTDLEAYDKQLNGYRDYILRKNNKEVNMYLYSIFDRKVRRVEVIE